MNMPSGVYERTKGIGYNKGENNPMYGVKSWNTGKKCPKISRALKEGFKNGRTVWNKGIVYYQIMGEKNPAKRPEVRKKLRENHPMKNPINRKKVSDALKGRLKPYQLGSKNPSWNGGTSFLPYHHDFTKKLKSDIRKRFGNYCMFCFSKGDQEKKYLCIHHIDYCKKNTFLNNLVPLHNSCHLRTNANRNHWKGYFREMMEILCS